MAVSINCLFLTVPWVGLQRVIMAFPGHTHLLFVCVFFYHIFFQRVYGLSLIKYSKTCVKRPLSKRPKIVFQECRSKVLQNDPMGFCNNFDLY